jgi:hypothetical protein
MELAGETATLYVSGSLGYNDVEALTSARAAARLGRHARRASGDPTDRQRHP